MSAALDRLFCGVWPRALAAAALLLSLLGPSLFGSAAHAEPRLVPRPSRLQVGTGRLPLRGSLTIAVASGRAEDRYAAMLLQQEIASVGVSTRIVDGSSGEIVLARSEGSGADAEGYRLEVRAAGAKVSAGTAAGLFYGVQTLRQLVEPGGIPEVTIEDRPALRWRGLLDDVSRGPVPTLASLKRRVRLVSEFKVNLYALYLETAFAYRSHPLLGTPGGSLTAEELRELRACADSHHVALLPLQQTFSHSERILAYETYRDLAETPAATTMSPEDPRSYVLAESLIAEIAPLGSAPFVHLGGDELTELGKGRSKATAERQGLAAAFTQHLKRLAQIASRQGKRPMIWGDGLLHPPKDMGGLPRDLMVASWEYLPRETYRPWIEPFQKARLEFLVCPGATNWSRLFPNLDQALPNIRVFTREGQQAGASGQLMCTWDDGGEALAAWSWYPVLYAAAAAWQTGDADPRTFDQGFDWALFRNPGRDAALAIEHIQRAHRLLGRVRPTDATLELAWLNPAHHSLDRRLLSMLAPIADSLRLTQEKALELLDRARRGARRNADQLDALVFAARRLHTLGQRAQLSKRIPELYNQALQAQASPDRAVGRIQQINGLIGQAREQTAWLRTEYQRLWLEENRPYWLANVLSQYDHDLWVWNHKAEELRVATVLFRNGRPLPSTEQMGFAP